MISRLRPPALAAGILSLILAALLAAPAAAVEPDPMTQGSTSDAAPVAREAGPSGAATPAAADEGPASADEGPAAAVPAADPTPEPKFRFTGYGTDHGVGLSQRGAAGRAKAGQTYDEILHHYFARVQLGKVAPDTTIRALVVRSYRAASTQTRILRGYGGVRWTIDTPDPAVRGLAFRASSTLVLVGRGETGAWHLRIVDKDGNVEADFTDKDAKVAVAPVPPTADDTRTGAIQVLIRPSTTYDTYRGVIRIGRVDGRLRLVNIVPIEPFVRSVTPQELGPANLQETLKSQAVVARSYFLAGLSTGTGFLAFDVESYRDSQSYKGIKGEKDATTTAVNATAYQVVAYKGTQPGGVGHVDVLFPNEAGADVADPDYYVARTFYHAVGGGATEASQNVFTGEKGIPGSKTPYLRGAPDLDPNGVAYDAGASAFAWSTRAFTLTQLSAILAHDSRTNVGTLTSWPIGTESNYRSTRQAAIANDDPTPDPANRGVSGRLTWVVLKGTRNGQAVSKQVAGWLFKSVFNTYRGSGDPIGSTMIFRTKVDP
jgi:peptidoglycan hydrolase-like amidase